MCATDVRGKPCGVDVCANGELHCDENDHRCWAYCQNAMDCAAGESCVPPYAGASFTVCKTP